MIIEPVKIILINVILGLVTLFPQRTLSLGFIGQPRSFLPHEIKTDSERVVSELVFRKLFKFEEGVLVNDLVDSWFVSENNTIYTIKLKDKTYWQDGTPINSDDILYTLTLHEGLKDEIEIEKISQKEVKIMLPTPTAILPSLLTFGLEPSHIRNQYKLQPTGSTSYRIARVQKERNKIESVTLQSFKKNKQYNRLTFKFYDNENDVKTAYKLGEVSGFLSNTSFNWPGINQRSIAYIGRYFSIIFNTETQKLRDPEIRKSLASSLNIDSLLKRHYYINSKKAQGPISYSYATKNVFLQNTYKPQTELTPAQANLLSDLQILLPNNQDGRQIEPFLRESWETKLGIPLQIEYEDLDKLINKGKGGEFEVLFIGHEVTPDPDRYTFWHSTQIDGGFNMAKFEDLRADKALEEGRRTSDPNERIKHYNIFQDVIETKVPAVFIFHPGQYFYLSDRFPVSIPKTIYYPSDIVKNL